MRKLQRRQQSPKLKGRGWCTKPLVWIRKTNSNNSKKSYWSYGGGQSNTWECGDPGKNVQGTSPLGWLSIAHKTRAHWPCKAGILEVKCWAAVPPSRSKQLEIHFSITMQREKKTKLPFSPFRSTYCLFFWTLLGWKYFTLSWLLGNIHFIWRDSLHDLKPLPECVWHWCGSHLILSCLHAYSEYFHSWASSLADSLLIVSNLLFNCVHQIPGWQLLI